MFDSVEVRNDNQDMALNKIVQGFKNHKGYTIKFSDDMTLEDKSLFLDKVKLETEKLKAV